METYVALWVFGGNLKLQRSWMSFVFECFQPTNDWSMAPLSESEQNGATITPQLTDTTAKNQDDNR